MANYKFINGKMQLTEEKEKKEYELVNGKLQEKGLKTILTEPKKTVGKTIGLLGSKFGSGILSTAEGLVDLGAGVLGTVTGSKKIKDYVKRDLTSETMQGISGGFDVDRGQNRLDKLDDQSYVKGDSFVGNLAQGAGQLAGMVGTGGLLGGASGISLSSKLSLPVAPMLSGAGGGFETAIKEDKGALATLGYAAGTGVVESATEALFSGVPIPGAKSSIDDLINVGLKGVKNNALRRAGKIAYNAIGEGTEEVLSDLGDVALRKLTGMSDVKQEYFQDFLMGAALGGLIGSSNVEGVQTEINNSMDALNGMSDIQVKQAIETGKPLDFAKIEPKTKLGKIKQQLINEWVDKGRVFKKISKQTGNQAIEDSYDATLAHQAVAQFEIGHKNNKGEFVGYQSDIEGKRLGPSQAEIFDKVNSTNKTELFDSYAKNLHNIDRVANKIETGIDVNESQKIVQELEQQNPEFKQVMEQVRTYNKNDLQNRINEGLISQKQADKMAKLYPNYVRLELENIDGPEFTNNIKDVKVKDTIQSAIEGEFQTKGVQEAMASQTIRVKKATLENRLANELSKHVKTIDNNVTLEANKDFKDSTIKGIRKKGESFSVDPARASKLLSRKLAKKVGEDTTRNKDILSYYKDGKRVDLQVNADIVKALQPAKRTALDDKLSGKALQKVAKLQREVLTAKNPIFAAKNFFKDIPDGAINSKYPGKYANNFPVALDAIFNPNSKNRGLYNQLMALGGHSNTIFDNKTGTFDGDKGIVGKQLDKIEAVNGMIEQGPRLAEFISALQAGETPAAAARLAADVTVNFKRGGDVAKAFNRNGLNFLNASIQGFDKFIRNFTEEPSAKKYALLLGKATAVGMLPEIFNKLMYKDDEEYANIRTEDKDKNYLFKKADGTFVKIPKGRAQSLFTSISRRILNGKADDEPGLAKFAVDQIGPANPFKSNIASPLIQAGTNKSFFGSDIVSQGLQDEAPSQQFDASTDIVSKKIGEIFNISPKKVNYVLNQYTGIIGDIVLPPLTPQAEPRLIEKTFGLDPAFADKNVSLFYDLQQELTEKKNSAQSSYDEVQQLKQINSATYDLNQLWAARRAIQDSELSYQEKRAQSKEVQKEINMFVKNVLNKIK